MKLLMNISFGESYPNFMDTVWSEKGALAARGYVFIIPASWVPDPPRLGEFTTTFKSLTEEVNYVKRMELAKTCLAWTFPPDPSAQLQRSPMLARFDVVNHCARRHST